LFELEHSGEFCQPGDDPVGVDTIRRACRKQR